MSKFSWLAMIAAMALGASASAQEVTQAVTGLGYNAATVQSPRGTTTEIVNAEAPSRIAHLKDGTKIEMDSDDSVYQVFPDGARTAAPDGMHTLATGETITVKDGKRIP